MSEAYERERQNNARLDELSAKVSALRGVTVDIYDDARAQDVIDNTVWGPSSSYAALPWPLLDRRLTRAPFSRPILSPQCLRPSEARQGG
jgi:hypothetical protein